MSRVASIKGNEERVLKYPGALMAIIGICGLLAGFGATWATTSYRISALEQQVTSVKNDSVSKDNGDTIKEMIKGIDQKMDLKFENVGDRLSKIEKRLNLK